MFVAVARALPFAFAAWSFTQMSASKECLGSRGELHFLFSVKLVIALASRKNRGSLRQAEKNQAVRGWVCTSTKR